MDYEIAEDRKYKGTWRVEAINYASDGEVRVAVFSGPDAEERAREYAQWKNQAQREAGAGKALSL
jgi:hypothetical protein